MNVFGKVLITHKSLGSSCTSSRSQTPRSNTPGSMQGLEAELDEHKKNHYYVSIGSKIQCIDDKYFA
jgi:hypothetical protein